MTQTRTRFALALWREAPFHGRPGTVSINEMALLAGCHPELIERLTRFGVIEEVAPRNFIPRYPYSELARLRRALRLRRDLGLNIPALSLVLELLDRIERLEDELDRMRNALT